MKFRTFFISLLAVLAALTACQQERGNYGIPSIKFGQESLTFTQDGGAAKINVTVTRDWTASTDADWLGIGRTAGTASEKPQEIEISVLPNGEYNRSATVTFVVGKKLITKAFTIYQEGPEGEAPITGPYYEYSLKTAGQGDYTIEDKTLPEGLSAVWTFDSKYGMKATAYAGGTNYASESWLVTPEITLSDTEANYVSFTHAGQYFGKIKEEATFWISEAGTKAQEEWIQLEVPVYPTSWTFVNSGDIDISAYRGKTVRFAFVYKSTASKAGTWEVDALTVSTTRSGEEPGGSDDPTPAEGVIYSDNFDKEAATQTYGSGSSWPYADQFENWQNPKGTGAANVSYEFAGISIRANSPSDGNYSIYAGSGTNNLFFGANNHFQVRNITLGGATNLSLTFGSEKYTQADSKFSKDEFKVYVSNTGSGASWVSLDYTFAAGTMPEGKWDLATSHFTVPQGTQSLYIYVTASVASAYRLDDLTLVSETASATAQSVDFGRGVDLGTQGSTPGGDNSQDPQPQPGNAIVATVADFLAAPESSTQLYQLTGTIGGSINTTYGNFDLTDATGTVYVYGMTATNLGYGATNDKSYASLGLQAGDVITLIGYRGSYTSNSGVKKDEVVYAYFVSKAQGGGDNSQDPSEDVSTDPSEDASVDPVEGMTIPVTVLAEMNQWQDNAQISEFEYQGYTFVIDGSASQTKPIYKINGSTQEEDIRMYANGKITVKAPAGQIMTGIAFTLSGKGLEQTATITASAGTVAAQKKGDTVITWNGQAQEVTFTVGASNDFGSNASKTSGQFCFKQINIQ